MSDSAAPDTVTFASIAPYAFTFASVAPYAFTFAAVALYAFAFGLAGCVRLVSLFHQIARFGDDRPVALCGVERLPLVQGDRVAVERCR